MFAHFLRLSPCAKSKVWRIRTFLWHNQSQTASRRSAQSWIKKKIFTDYSRPNSFRLPRPGSGSSINWKYVGITCSFATRKTLRIPNLLNWINKSQPEQSRSHVIKNTAPEPESCLRKQRAPKQDPFHFYKSSATLVESWNVSIFIAVFSHINQPCPKWAKCLRKSGTYRKHAQNGQMLYDNCWAIRLIVALLSTFMSQLLSVPSPQGGFGALSPSKQCTKPPRLKYENNKLVEFCQFVQCQDINRETKNSH